MVGLLSDLITDIVTHVICDNSRVTNVGYGDAELLEYAVADKNVTGEGIEPERVPVPACVNKGLATIRRDVKRSLKDYAGKESEGDFRVGLRIVV